jgi:hypothetical protein
MAAELLATARKLPSGQDRHNALQEIERFRARITALQRPSGMAQSPQPYDLHCVLDAAVLFGLRRGILRMATSAT